MKLATNQIPKTHPRALTTITVLHDLLGRLSFDVPEEISDPSKRPTNEILETAYEDLCRKIDELLQACGNIRERMENAASARNVRAPKNAESTGHAFMRPAIQKAIAFCLRQVVFEGAGNRISWDDAKGRLQTMNWEIGKPPWTAVFNVDNAKMQTSKEFSELLRELLRVHLAPSSKQEIKRARKHYKELRKFRIRSPKRSWRSGCQNGRQPSTSSAWHKFHVLRQDSHGSVAKERRGNRFGIVHYRESVS